MLGEFGFPLPSSPTSALTTSSSWLHRWRILRPMRVMMVMNESSLKEHPHPYISCNTVFDRMLCKLVGLEFLFLRNFLQGSQYT
jgi:hypothetical protein